MLNTARSLTKRFARICGQPGCSYVRLFNRMWRLPFPVPYSLAESVYAGDFIDVDDCLYAVAYGELLPLVDAAGKRVRASQYR
jgi:hypothetical protein